MLKMNVTVYLLRVLDCTLHRERLALDSKLARAELVLHMQSRRKASRFDVMHDDC